MNSTAEINNGLSLRDKIVVSLFNCPKFNGAVNSMHPEHLREDLKSEVITEMLKMPLERMVGMYERGELSFFAIRLVTNFITGARSKFNRTYRRTFVDEMPDLPCPELNGRVKKEEGEERVFEALLEIRKLAYQKNPNYLTDLYPDVHWYNQYMLSLYMKLGNYQLMSRETKIPVAACNIAVVEGLKGLRKRFGIEPPPKTNKRLRLNLNKR